MEVEEAEQKNTLYGWYSIQQKRITGRSFKYSTPDGREVYVTEVSSYPESCAGFSDRTYIGEVDKLICRYQRSPENYKKYLPKKMQYLEKELANWQI